MRKVFLGALIAVALTGCDNPQRTVDRLRTEITAYKTAPTDAAQARIEIDLGKLDAQIARLQDAGKTTEASAYRSTASNLRADYRAARMVGAIKDAQTAVQDLGQAFKEAGQSIGDAFRNPSPTPTSR